MTAAVLHGAHDLRVEDVAVPEIGPEDVLIRVRVCGVCASDIHYVEHGRIGRYVVDQPMIVGHEIAGEVIARGAAVRSLSVGARVAVEPGVSCGRCQMCKSGRYNLCPEVSFYATPPINGAMSEYAVVRYDFAHEIPEHVTWEQAALCEPISVGIHCANLTRLEAGETVVILGAGPIGLSAVAAALQFGAGQVIVSDVFDTRLAVARRLGATTHNVTNGSLADLVVGLTRGRGADRLFDTSGVRSVIESAPDMMRNGGAIAIVGLPADDSVTYHMGKIVDKELSIHGVFRYANTYPAAVALVASGRYPIEEIVTDRFPLDHAVAAFDRAANAKDQTIKVIVAP